VAAARKAIITALHGKAVLDITSSSVPKFGSAAGRRQPSHKPIGVRAKWELYLPSLRLRGR
jgi:hypothetical protein